MRVLCVIGHPEPHGRSFCHKIFSKTIETLKLNNHEVKTTDIYRDGLASLPSINDFENPDETKTIEEHQMIGEYKEVILREQSKVEWCDFLMIFTPIFWLGPDAAVMSWWNRVFGEGWAFPPDAYNDPTKLTYMGGKKAMVVAIAGSGQEFYGPNALHVTMEELLYPLTFRCFYFCGFTPIRSQTFFGLNTADPQTRIEMINEWAKTVSEIETREQINYSPYYGDSKSLQADEDRTGNHKLLRQLGDLPAIPPKENVFF